MLQVFKVVLALSSCASVVAAGCSTDLDCSLNGVCTSGACVCDKPWGGDGCGVLQYKTTSPASGKGTMHNARCTALKLTAPCSFNARVPLAS